METTELRSNGVMVVVPAAIPELVERRRELSQMSQDDPELLYHLWWQLGNEFYDVGYETNAHNCWNKADHYAMLAQRMQ